MKWEKQRIKLSTKCSKIRDFSNSLKKLYKKVPVTLSKNSLVSVKTPPIPLEKASDGSGAMRRFKMQQKIRRKNRPGKKLNCDLLQKMILVNIFVILIYCCYFYYFCFLQFCRVILISCLFYKAAFFCSCSNILLQC